MSKRVTITIPDQTHALLEIWAEQQGRSTANLAAFLVELGVRQGKERGEIPDPPKPKK